MSTSQLSRKKRTSFDFCTCAPGNRLLRGGPKYSNRIAGLPGLGTHRFRASYAADRLVAGTVQHPFMFHLVKIVCGLIWTLVLSGHAKKHRTLSGLNACYFGVSWLWLFRDD